MFPRTAVLTRLPVLAVLAAAAVTACGSKGDGVIDITFDPCQTLVLSVESSATVEQAASLSDAAVLWNRLGTSRLTVDEVAGAPRLAVRFEQAAANFHGVYEDEIGVVFINTALGDRDERAVTIAHEVGHAFGLLHVDREERRSVMNRANLDVVPTSEDADALVTLWGACSRD